MKYLFAEGQFAIGLFFGLCFSVLVYVLSTGGIFLPSDPTVRGAIFGGFFAGAATILAVVLTAVFDQVQRAKSKQKSDERRLMLILAKAVSYSDDVTKTYRHWMGTEVDNRISFDIISSNVSTESFWVVKPFVGTRFEQHFDIEDEAFAISLGYSDLANLLGNNRRSNISFIDLYCRYSDLIEAQQRETAVNPNTRYSGTLAQSEQSSTYGQLLNLRDLDQAVRELSHRGAIGSRKLISEVEKILENAYRRKISFREERSNSPTIKSTFRDIIEKRPFDLSGFG